MPPVYEAVTFIPPEAQFIANVMQAYSQNRALGSESDAGSVGPVTQVEISLALSIVSKVNNQIMQKDKRPISFTSEESYLMQRLFTTYIQTHGKPQGDIDWTYYIRLDSTSTQLVVNILRKLGSNIQNLPSLTYPQSYNPFPRI